MTMDVTEPDDEFREVLLWLNDLMLLTHFR